MRESIEAIAALPDALRAPVTGAYLGAVRDVFWLIVGGAAMASAMALLISRRKIVQA